MFTARRSGGGTFYPSRGSIYPELAQRGLVGAAGTLSRQTKNTGRKTKTPSKIDAGSMVSAAALGSQLWPTGAETAPVVTEGVDSAAQAGLNNLPTEGVNAMGEAAANGPLEADAFGNVAAPEMGAQAELVTAPAGEVNLAGTEAANAAGTSLESTVGAEGAVEGGLIEGAADGLTAAGGAVADAAVAAGEGVAAAATAVGEGVASGAEALWALLFL